MAKKKTTEQFKQEVYDLVENEYTVLGEYIGANINILIRHNSQKCNNHEFEMLPSNFLRGYRCPECANINKRKTHEQFVKEVYDLYKNEYTVLGKYINNKTKIRIKHNCLDCNNHEWDIRPDNFLNEEKCPICQQKISKINSKNDGEIVYNAFIEYGFIPQFKSEDYINNRMPLPYICPNHKEKGVQYKTYANIKTECPYCSLEKSSKDRRLDWDVIYNCFIDKNYTPLFSKNDYINNSQDLPYICNKHKNKGIQYIKYGNLKNNKGCKYCGLERMSKENSHLWKGGITPINKQIRQSLKYKEWVNKVFERDDYTCQCCKQRGVKLEAHHIENFADNEDLRFDVSNGVTLCQKCHNVNFENSFHKIYGTKNNNKIQFKEYLKFREELLR